jgi:predicted ribosomally synthesized peptide with nif11-like leader
MSDQLAAFLKAVQSNPDLLAKLKAANNPSEISAIANDAGFSFGPEELSRADSVVSEYELESVVGGGVCWSNTSSTDCADGEFDTPGIIG